MSKNKKEYDYFRWQLEKGASMHSVHPERGDEDETRTVWVGEDDYLRLKKKHESLLALTKDIKEELQHASDRLLDLMDKANISGFTQDEIASISRLLLSVKNSIDN